MSVPGQFLSITLQQFHLLTRKLEWLFHAPDRSFPVDKLTHIPFG